MTVYNKLTIADITRFYLYGENRVPNLDSPNLVKNNNDHVFVDVDLATYMTEGAGRFALAARFELIQKFLNDTSVVIPANTYTKEEIAAYYGMSQAYYGLTVKQREVADSTNDYVERVWIYNTTGFIIGGDTKFVIDSDGTRHIDDLYILPRNGYEDFDFVGGDGITDVLGEYAQASIDPSRIGRTVDIFFQGDAPTTARYDLAAYNTEIDKILSWTTGTPAVILNLPALETIPPALFNEGITKFVSEDNRAILYGTDNADDLSTSTFDYAVFNYISEYIQSGAKIYAGGGNDTVDINFGGTKFFVDGGAGQDVVSFVELTHGAEIETTAVEEVHGTDYNDKLIVDATATQMVFDAGFGEDEISFEKFLAGVTVTFSSSIQNIQGLQFASVEKFGGTQFGDNFTGLGGSQKLSGDLGNDLISGGNDNDFLFGDEGNDILSGDAGNDLLSGGQGDDSLTGGDGNDLLLSSSGSDTLDGGAGSDVFAIVWQPDVGNHFVTLKNVDANDKIVFVTDPSAVSQSDNIDSVEALLSTGALRQQGGFKLNDAIRSEIIADDSPIYAMDGSFKYVKRFLGSEYEYVYVADFWETGPQPGFYNTAFMQQGDSMMVLPSGLTQSGGFTGASITIENFNEGMAGITFRQPSSEQPVNAFYEQWNTMIDENAPSRIPQSLSSFWSS